MGFYSVIAVRVDREMVSCQDRLSLEVLLYGHSRVGIIIAMTHKSRVVVTLSYSEAPGCGHHGQDER